MGFVSWTIAVIVAFTVMVMIMGAVALTGNVFGVSIPEWIVVVSGLLIGFFVVGSWATHLVFELINRYTSPKWQLHLDKRPIPSEYRVHRAGEERDSRFERGWRLWLVYLFIAAFWAYYVFFYNPAP